MRPLARTAILLLVGAFVPLALEAARASESPRWLEDRVQAFLLERAPEGPVRIEVPPLDAFSLEGVDPAAVEVAISTDAKPPLAGAVPLRIAIRRAGRELERHEVTAQVEAAHLAVVAARALARGDVLAEADLTLAPVENPMERRSAVDAIEGAVGKRMRRNVEAGQPVRSAWLEEVPLVKRGEPVRITLLRGNLRIESTGIARQDGRAGDVVRLENPTSHREILGRVGPDGAVHVTF